MKSAVCTILPATPTRGDVCYRSSDGSFHICVVDGTWSSFNTFKEYELFEVSTRGVWINGDPIYRKVVDCSPLGPGPGKSVPHNIIGIRQIVRLKGTATDTTAPLLNPFIEQIGQQDNFSSADTLTLSVDDTNVNIGHTGGQGAFDTAYVIVEYTRDP